MTLKERWHNLEIVAAVKIKTGLSLRRLSESHELHHSTLQQALHRSYPKAEKIIAEAIGVPVQTLWPDRFDQNGARLDNRKKSQAKTGGIRK